MANSVHPSNQVQPDLFSEDLWDWIASNEAFTFPNSDLNTALRNPIILPLLRLKQEEIRLQIQFAIRGAVDFQQDLRSNKALPWLLLPTRPHFSQPPTLLICAQVWVLTVAH